MDLADFLLERIAEDEAAVRAYDREWPSSRGGTIAAAKSDAYIVDTEYASLLVDPSRVLAECDAKRRIIEAHGRLKSPAVFDGLGAHVGLAMAMRFLALSHADHPDYQQEWKP